MNQKTLIGLVAAAVVAIAIAVVLNRQSRPQSDGGGEAAAYLAPGLAEHVNDVARLVVTGAGGKTIATLARGDGGWTLAEKGGYAVDTGKLREFLLKLADAKLAEQKTSNKDKYALLGVEDVSSGDAKGVQVEVDGLAQPLKLIVGNAAHGGGSYVRRAGEAQSWQASTALSVPKEAADWLRKDLVDIPASRIASVTVTHADGRSVRVYKDSAGDANYKVADVPKGREAGSPFTANGIAGALAGLRFDDVAPAKDAPPGAQALKARYAAFDGLAIDVTGWSQDGKDYAQFKASLDAAQADKGIAEAQAKAKADFDTAAAAAEAAKNSKDKDAAAREAAEAPVKPLSVSDPARDRQNRLDALNKEVADLNARFDGWSFVLPAYKYANLDKSMDDLLKPLEEKKPDDAAKAAPKKAPAKPKS